MFEQFRVRVIDVQELQIGTCYCKERVRVRTGLPLSQQSASNCGAGVMGVYTVICMDVDVKRFR